MLVFPHGPGISMKTPDVFEDDLEPVHAPDLDVLLLQEYMKCHRAEYAYNFRMSKKNPSALTNAPFSINLSEFTSINSSGDAQRTSGTDSSKTVPITNGGKKTEDVSNHEPFNLINEYEVKSEKVYAIDIKDPWIFIKIEQIINSYESVIVSIDKYNVVVYANKFMRNENPSTILYRNYLQIYYYLRINLQKQTYTYNSFA